jgi:hypothetical protein
MRKSLAKFRRKIRHPRKIKSPLCVQRVINLPAAITGLTKRFQKRPQLFRGFPQ